LNIDTDENLPEHPKTLRLCGLLNNPVGWAYLWKLWRWCARYQPDGDLSDYSPGEIELAVGWTSMDGRFYAAAVKAGFIDRDESGKGAWVHNWHRRQGAGLIRMEIDRTRKALGRAKQEGDTDGAARLQAHMVELRGKLDHLGTSNVRPPDVHALSDGKSENSSGQAPDGDRPADVSALLCSALPFPSLGGSARARDPGATEPEPVPPAPPQRLTPYDLLHKWGIKWRKKYSLPWAPDAAASSCARDLLEDVIGAMPEHDRVEAMADLDAALDRYLDDRGKGDSLVRNRHPFKWFVDRFNSYRAMPSGSTVRAATGEVAYDEL
jgi:hypothetical protein